LRAKRKNGETFHVAISLSPLQHGQEQWVLATVRDTTERAQMNEALHRGATLYRDTLDNMLE
jgi:PAS domain S-box-containing protein